MAKHKLIFLLLLFMTFLNGCSVDKGGIQKALKRHLLESYGITNYEIIEMKSDGAAGENYEAVIDIKEPYHTTATIIVYQDSLNINREYSDNIYFEIFKGAYVKQHPKVIALSNKIIEKYNLERKMPLEGYRANKNFYYYLHVRLDPEQEKSLVKEFKQKQSINTKELLPDLKVYSDEPLGYRGIINFEYFFNGNNKGTAVPRAEDILKEFKESGVLTEGIYCIVINTMYLSNDKFEYGYGMDSKYSNVKFEVDSKGNFSYINFLTLE